MKVGKLRQYFGALVVMWLCCITVPASGQELRELCAPSEATDPQPHHINGAKPYIYKTVKNTALRLHVFSSTAREADVKSPAVVFFYGGGFIIGDIRRFQTQATHLALRGLVTILVDYRVTCRHDSTILDSIADSKSAMRWVRGHADELGIDPSRIAAVGSSAGGLLAASAALISDFNDPGDKEIDPRPNALILYNPALDPALPSTKERIAVWQGKAVADRADEYSPLNHLEQGLPPTIIFQGTADEYTPYAIAEKFCLRAKDLKFQCELVKYPGAPHGFTEIWLGLEDPHAFPKTEFWASDTSRRTDAFLAELGWLSSH